MLGLSVDLFLIYGRILVSRERASIGQARSGQLLGRITRKESRSCKTHSACIFHGIRDHKSEQEFSHFLCPKLKKLILKTNFNIYVNYYNTGFI